MNEACVYIVGDDEAVRHSLSLMIEVQGYRVASFSAATDFLAAAASLPAGVLITDIRMPKMDGLELQQRLGERAFPISVILITGHGDVTLAVRAMKAGAVDFIEKLFAADAILTAIEAALLRLATGGAQDPLAENALEKLLALTSREREVLDGLVASLPNKAIAYDLAISPRTVEIHRARVMQKMQAKSLSELVRLALVAGISPPRDNGGAAPLQTTMAGTWIIVGNRNVVHRQATRAPHLGAGDCRIRCCNGLIWINARPSPAADLPADRCGRPYLAAAC